MITFRNATTKDIDDIVALEHDCFPDPWSAKSFASSLDNPFCEVIVAVMQVKKPIIVAYAVMLHMYEQGEIAKVAVAPAYHRQGIATEIVNWLIKIAEHEDVETIFLDVRESNKAARKLYERVGFVQFDTTEGFYTNPPEASVKMRYDIGEHQC